MPYMYIIMNVYPYCEENEILAIVESEEHAFAFIEKHEKWALEQRVDDEELDDTSIDSIKHHYSNYHIVNSEDYGLYPTVDDGILLVKVKVWSPPQQIIK